MTTLCRALHVPIDRALAALIGFHAGAFEHDPFARGAYTYARPGGRRMQELLAEPLERTLFFAGEATDAQYSATVAGAIQSAERAARELLEAG